MTGRIGHQELMKIQSVTVELKPASGDMGEARRPLACLLTSLAGRSGLIGPMAVTSLTEALSGSGEARPFGGGASHDPSVCLN